MNNMRLAFLLIVGLLFPNPLRSQDHWETAIFAGDNWSYIIPSTQPSSDWNTINFDDYKKRFDVDISQLYSDAISKHLKTGLLEKTETSLKLSSKGLLLANELFVDLLPDNESHLINKLGD